MSLIGILISVIVTLIILGVIWWAIQQLLPLIPLPEPFRTIIYVLMVVIMVLVVLWVILTLLGAAGVNVPVFHGRLVTCPVQSKKQQKLLRP